MTRRERAAMALALEVLRSSARVQDGLTPTAGGIEVVSSLLVEEATLALAVGLSWLTRPLVDTQPEWGRLIRARLALYLRARLRADDGHYRRARITPLWQQAPATGMWRHECWRWMWRHGCWRWGLTTDIPRGEACAECGDREPRRGGA